MKIRPVGDELLHADGQAAERTKRMGGQTDMTKLVVAFPNCANSLEKYIQMH